MIPSTYSLEGQEIAVTFLDHVLNGDKPLPCRIWGRCHRDTPEFLVVDVWIPMDDEPRNTENNTECFCIVRSTIQHIHKIERRPLERT